MEQRIKNEQWKAAAKARYLDLRDSLRSDVVNMDLHIEPDNQQLIEMRLIRAIAKLHGIIVEG